MDARLPSWIRFEYDDDDDANEDKGEPSPPPSLPSPSNNRRAQPLRKRRGSSKPSPRSNVVQAGPVSTPPPDTSNTVLALTPLKLSSSFITATTTNTTTTHCESPVLLLARANDWQQVLIRCQSHPFEATPVPLTLTQWPFAIRKNKHPFVKSPASPSSLASPPPALSNVPLYRESLLGIFCAVDWTTNSGYSDTPLPVGMTPQRDFLLSILHAILCAAPTQVRCSQLTPGHTPLRAALRNSSCPVELLHGLLRADQEYVASQQRTSAAELTASNCPAADAHHTVSPGTIKQNGKLFSAVPAICQPDEDGLFPLDHLIKNIQLGVFADQLSPSFMTANDVINAYLHLLLKMLETTFQALQLCNLGVAHSLPINVTTSSWTGPLMNDSDEFESEPHQTWLRQQFAVELVSPLVRLFSLGTSYGLLPASRATGIFFWSEHNRLYDNTSRLERIYQTTRFLLQKHPNLVYRISVSTGCSPLHVALRNYGNDARLIRELLKHDEPGSVMKHRNRYGDLPLHVACAVGVPLDILRLLLARTIQAAELTTARTNLAAANALSGVSSCMSSSAFTPPNKLVWSQNRAGYTPVDLEWIRHVEQGSGFLTHRAFYPLDAIGIRKPSGRDAELYNLLLEQAVKQVMATRKNYTIPTDMRTVTRSSNFSSEWDAATNDDVNQTSDTTQSFGLLLHRIFLVIRASFYDSFSRLPVDLSGDILHLAVALSGPVGPALPKPILDLIRWKYPEQLGQTDHLGRLPIHYCFDAATMSSARCPLDSVKAVDTSFMNWNTTSRPAQSCFELQPDKATKEWRQKTKDILAANLSACRVRDHYGRLVLHYALDCPSDCAAVMENVVRLILDAFPEAVDVFDPVSRMFPFQLASQNLCLSINCVYDLLRRSPDVLKNSFEAQNCGGHS